MGHTYGCPRACARGYCQSPFGLSTLGDSFAWVPLPLATRNWAATAAVRGIDMSPGVGPPIQPDVSSDPFTHPDVLVVGYAEASMVLKTPRAKQVKAIIAIHGHREHPVETAGVPHCLILEFDDTESSQEGDLLDTARTLHRQRQAAESGLSLTPPTLEHARSIIDFAHSIRNMGGLLLCHCLGGVSRSPAAALLCLATWMGSGNERGCVERLLEIRACALPHRDLVRYGDTLLHRDGRLITALDSIMTT